MRYKYDITVFDEIKTPEQAYWIGFIWSDGYVLKRKRNNYCEYALKLSLAKHDYDHLEKFVKFMKSDLPIHEYVPCSKFENAQNEVRVMINSGKFGKKLYDDFGIFPFRNDPTQTIERIPKELYKYFILGILDADGSFSFYETEDKGSMQKKVAVSFQCVEKLIKFLQDFLYDNKLIESKQKYSKRHEGRDGDTFSYRICGAIQAPSFLDYLYDDKIIETCLNRKYNKYKELKKFLK